jgi:hypothetical protein
VPIDPRKATSHHPGSPGKLRVLRTRARAKLALFVAGDALGARRLNEAAPSAVSKRTLLERHILLVASYKPLSSRELAVRSGAKWSSGFRRALAGLHSAGVLTYDRRSGWRLARI